MSIIEHFSNRRDTAANWATKNSILIDGELGLEKDTGRFKFGDGATQWNSLPYAGGTGVITLAAGSPYPNPAPPAGTLVLRLL